MAKQHAVELLEGSNFVDEVVAYDFPWTATSGKYQLDRYNRREITALIQRLRSEKFDLSVDCRMDARSNLLTRRIGASRRIGYDFGGGGFLLTDALPAPPADQHKVDDWMGLLAPLMASRPNGSDAEPQLRVLDEERSEARRVLESYEVSIGVTSYLEFILAEATKPSAGPRRVSQKSHVGWSMITEFGF